MTEWWLLDSAASRSVISEKWISKYQVLKQRRLESALSFTTASGQAMTIDQEVQVRCHLETYSQNKLVKVPVVLRVLVADTQHNLLSTSQMMRMGWTICFSQEDGVTCEMKGSMIHPMLWVGVPWVKVVLPDNIASHHDQSFSESPRKSRTSSRSSKVSGTTIEEPPGLEQVLDSDYDEPLLQSSNN